MNLKQLAKLMTAGVLAMAAVPAIGFARSHHPLSATAPTLMASTTTRTPSARKTLKSRHVALISTKRHRATKVKPLVSHKKTHTALKHTTHTATKLTAKKKTSTI
jgi:hypothetical protein